MEITTRIGCSVNCLYCPQDRLIRQYAKRSGVLQMSLNLFKTCVDKISRGIDILFSGMCEPWLNPDCTAMLLYAHKKGHNIKVFTSLVGMQLSDVDLFKAIPFKSFTIHLPSKETYENINVNDHYLSVLSKILESGIKSGFVFFGTLHPKIAPLIKEKIFPMPLHTRAGNIKFQSVISVRRMRGKITCCWKIKDNVLFPNGDVALCCMDYNLDHVLGNLVSCEYKSLFKGEAFIRVKNGLNNENIDILCRYCELAASAQRNVSRNRSSLLKR